MDGDEVLASQVFQTILAYQQRSQACVLATVVKCVGSTPGKPGSKLVIGADGAFVGTVGGGCVENEVFQLARKVLHTSEPELHEFVLTPEEAADEGLACGGRLWIFIEPIVVPELIVCGAGHVGAALCELATRAGFRTTVVDDRQQFANGKNLPDAAAIMAAPFEEALSPLSIQSHHYIVIVTRGHRHDATCLRWAVEQPARYVGMISSRAKRKVIFKRLRDDGVDEAALARVHAPIGYRIGAVTPAEIAVAIVAQLIAVRRNADERYLPPDADDAEAAWRERAGLTGSVDSDRPVTATRSLASEVDDSPA